MIRIGYYSESECICSYVDSKLLLPIDAVIVNEEVIIPSLNSPEYIDEYVPPKPKVIEWECWDAPGFVKTFCHKIER